VAIDILIESVADLARMRRVVGDFARLTGGVAIDVVLATNELATNSLLHTGRPCRVTGSYPAVGVIRIEVADTGSASFELPSALGGTDAVGGRGLMIVGSVASRWGTSVGRDVTRVWFEVDLGQPARPARCDRPPR
jgi:anti-sigma regulatory factor (Ser/Thr protein kinase)